MVCLGGVIDCAGAGVQEAVQAIFRGAIKVGNVEGIEHGDAGLNGKVLTELARIGQAKVNGLEPAQALDGSGWNVERLNDAAQLLKLRQRKHAILDEHLTGGSSLASD